MYKIIKNNSFLQKEKIYKELMGIYGMQDSKSTPVKFKDLQYMNYLECVINETLRLFPSVPFIGRYLTKDIKIGLFININVLNKINF